MRTAYLTLLAGALVCLAFPSVAQADDAAVAARLKTLGVKATVDEDGDYRVVYNYASEKRTQLVFVAGTTLDVKGTQIRKIFAPAAAISGGKVDGAVALTLLEESGSSAIGGWEIRSGILYYAIEVPEPLTAVQLKAAMDICAELADDKEIELTGADEL